MVSVAAFDWHPTAPETLRRTPLGETVVMPVRRLCGRHLHKPPSGEFTGSRRRRGAAPGPVSFREAPAAGAALPSTA
ncbi:hypothetical protein C1708_14295 [Streptomyces sp. DH-12]|nr:hypothetical protein C1708_14295 [Streptomyces sp. DH-12]